MTRNAFRSRLASGRTSKTLPRKTSLRERVEAHRRRRGGAALAPSRTRATSASSTRHLEDQRARVADLEERLVHRDDLAELDRLARAPRRRSARAPRCRVTRDASDCTAAAWRAAFAVRSMRSARCCASFAASCPSSCVTRARARSSSACATEPARARGLSVRARSGARGREVGRDGVDLGAERGDLRRVSCQPAALAAERSAWPRLRSYADDGVVDAREQVARLARAAPP